MEVTLHPLYLQECTWLYFLKQFYESNSGAFVNLVQSCQIDGLERQDLVLR